MVISKVLELREVIDLCSTHIQVLSAKVHKRRLRKLAKVLGLD